MYTASYLGGMDSDWQICRVNPSLASYNLKGRTTIPWNWLWLICATRLLARRADIEVYWKTFIRSAAPCDARRESSHWIVAA